MIPGLAQWVKDLVMLSAVVWVADAAQIPSFCGCDVAVAPIQPLAWELSHATGVALKRKEKKKEEEVLLSTRHLPPREFTLCHMGTYRVTWGLCWWLEEAWAHSLLSRNVA